jgi:murein L,D-transpeptidase YcbB/YkuD
LAALNVPVEERVRQIERNLERRRWSLDNWGERYLLINIPGFELDVFEGHHSVLNMKAVVGMPSRPTPVFSAEVTRLVLNPSWEVPHNIAVSDIIPAVRKDPDYLTKRNIKVFEGWNTDAREVDPSTLDWLLLSKDNFPYRLRQEPGPANPLGAVKFILPNPYSVYLHDTPARALFARSDRACSSGCVRVEKAIELADYLLGDEAAWNRERILAVIDQAIEQTIRLPRPIPVHFVYWTSWVDSSGTVHFRKDIYGLDPLLDEALAKVKYSARDEEASSR